MPLWLLAEKNNDKTSPSAHACIRQNQPNQISKEAFLYTRQKASMTVEASIVIPLLVCFMVSLLFWFRLIQIQAVVEEALLYAARKTAIESSVIEDEELLLLGAKGHVLKVLREYECIENYVELGNMGVWLLGSYVGEEYICLKAHYNVKFPVFMFGLDRIDLWSREMVRKWTGNAKVRPEETYVYITASGEVYHKTPECRVLNLKISSCTLREISMRRGENGQKYYACICCAEEISSESPVFFTPYGRLYHLNSNCSYIKREIQAVVLSEVGNKRPCSYCY